jgi:hypothetical protein
MRHRGFSPGIFSINAEQRRWVARGVITIHRLFGR